MNYPTFYPFTEIKFQPIEVMTSRLSGEIVVYGTRSDFKVVRGRTHETAQGYYLETGIVTREIVDDTHPAAQPDDGATGIDVIDFDAAVRAHHAKPLATPGDIDSDVVVFADGEFNDVEFGIWLANQQ